MVKVEHSIIQSDPGRIRQIITNLLSNAIKFTQQGEIIIAVELLPIPANHQQFRLQASVSDTGIGIPEDKQRLLFDSFSQLDASTTRKFGGTGLGLTIAKKLSELMGGNIQVSSQQGQGSCFEFNVVVQRSKQSILVIPEFDIKLLHLLLADPNIMNRKVMKRQLEHWGANVDEAADAESALYLCNLRIQQAEKPFYNLAFINMTMPGISGIELAKTINKDPRLNNMKLVIMTSINNQGDTSFFSDLGFSAYFPKPVTTSDLLDALNIVVMRKVTSKRRQAMLIDHRQDSVTNWSKQNRLLLVEDNQINQLVAKGILKKIGLETDIAANGNEALISLNQAPEKSPYTLILMDCQMPEMDGYEASRLIRAGKTGKRYLNIPIIAMTANAMQGDREKCLKAGMSDYLSKPINFRSVYDKLKQWLIKA